MVDRELMQKENLKSLVDNGAFKFTNTFFPYTSGEIGPYFVNSENVMNNGADYSRAIEDMADLISDVTDNIDVVSGGESRDWVFSFPVASYMSIPPLMIYNNLKMRGPNMEGKTAVHVADLNNQGSSIRDKWLPAIEDAGGKLKDVFFYVDRLEDGVKVIYDLGLNSHAVVPLDGNAWGYLQDQGIVNSEIYGNLMKRMEDKGAWARNMLRTEQGLGKLASVLNDNDPKVVRKGLKIVYTGYQDMTKELEMKLLDLDVNVVRLNEDLGVE